MCSWLYAGNPEYPAVLTKYVSENPSGAGNQQERPAFDPNGVGGSNQELIADGTQPIAGILRGHTPANSVPTLS
jgi:hypothetical protein